MYLSLFKKIRFVVCIKKTPNLKGLNDIMYSANDIPKMSLYEFAFMVFLANLPILPSNVNNEKITRFIGR